MKNIRQQIVTKLCTVANVVTRIKKSRYALKNTWQQIITKLNTLVNFVSYLRTPKCIEKHMTIVYYATQYTCERCDIDENILKHWKTHTTSTRYQIQSLTTKNTIMHCTTHDSKSTPNSVPLWTLCLGCKHHIAL